MVYARKVKNQELTFQVSGMLWKRSLVMRDTQTGSLWSHILGECMRGELKGAVLEIIPATMTTWADWKKHYPRSSVLNMSRTAWNYERSFYQDPRRFVFGVVFDGEAKAYPFDVLEKRKIIQDKVGDRHVLIVFDPKSTRAVVYDRRAGKKVLRFRKKLQKGALVDRTTGSRWNLGSGKAIGGKMKDQQLRILPAIVSYRHAWEKFHPDSEYAKPARE